MRGCFHFVCEPGSSGSPGCMGFANAGVAVDETYLRLEAALVLTSSWEVLLWMTLSEAPKALQASECNELLDRMRASCCIFAQHQPDKFMFSDGRYDPKKLRVPVLYPWFWPCVNLCMYTCMYLYINL